jgi:hypothetical protein
MALIDLWESAREAIKDKHIQQVISFAGTGKLSDGSETSKEFRSYLSYIPSDLLARYATECLSTSFDQSGFALQDIVNQIGKRLSFEVVDGSYRGKKGFIGFDGIWKSSMGDDIVVEVKTTDAYRIDLDTLATYRASLIKAERISERDSSILIVVGRQDTGDLEAQIRGSRHAWDIRLISVESLIRLMKLKETVEDPTVIRKICTILTPQEFTRVDGIIDLVFSTAEEVSATGITVDGNGTGPTIDQLEMGIGDDIPTKDEERSNEATAPDKRQQALFHEQCVAKVVAHLKANLVKTSRTTYRSPDGSLALSCTVSKAYARQTRVLYWFAFHPNQQEQLHTARKAFAAFGCGTDKTLFLFPFVDFASWLSGLNQTVNEKRHYWHVHIIQKDGRWMLLRKADFQDIDITDYLI